MIIGAKFHWSERNLLSKIQYCITLNGFDFAIELSIHHSCKLRKKKLSFKFMFKKVNPSTSSKIIHNSQEVFKPLTILIAKGSHRSQ